MFLLARVVDSGQCKDSVKTNNLNIHNLHANEKALFVLLMGNSTSLKIQQPSMVNLMVKLHYNFSCMFEMKEATTGGVL